MVKIVKIEDLDTACFEFSVPKKTGERYYTYVTYKPDADSLAEQVYVQTPRMRLKSVLTEPFVDFTLPSNSVFTNGVAALDQKILERLKEQKEELFPGKDLEDSFLEVGLMPSVKLDASSKELSKLKLRCPKDVLAYDSSKKEISLDTVELDAEVTVIVNLVGLWFTKSRWGTAYNICQLKLHNKRTEPIRECMFADDVEDTEEEPEDIGIPPGL